MSTYSPGDEAAIPYTADWGHQAEEGKQQVVFALRREAIELYGDLLPHNGRILRGRLATDEQREAWDTMSAMLSAADLLEATP